MIGTTAALGTAVAVGVGALAVALEGGHGRRAHDDGEARRCAAVAHERIHVVLLAADEDEWPRAARALWDAAACPQRVHITLCVRTPAEALASPARRDELLGAAYADLAQQLRAAYRPGPLTRAGLAIAVAPSAPPALYTLLLHVGAEPERNWDETLVRLWTAASAQWPAAAVALSAPLARADGPLGTFCAFSRWDPRTGAPVPRVRTLAAALPAPFVGLTPWLSTECTFALTAHVRMLGAALAESRFWEARGDEFADRHRVVRVAFAANLLLCALPEAVFRGGGAADVYDGALDAVEAAVAAAAQPDGGGGDELRRARRALFAWPSTSAAFAQFAGIDAAARTITPAAVLGLVNLLPAEDAVAPGDWRCALWSQWMDAQYTQRYGSVSEARRRAEAVTLTAAGGGGAR